MKASVRDDLLMDHKEAGFVKGRLIYIGGYSNSKIGSLIKLNVSENININVKQRLLMYQKRQRLDSDDKYVSILKKGLESLTSPTLNFYEFLDSPKYKYYYAHFIENYLKIAAFIAFGYKKNKNLRGVYENDGQVDEIEYFFRNA
jgi:hypothetical protein